jgi:hypothetical protein
MKTILGMLNDRSVNITHTNSFPKKLKPETIQRFGEEVSQLVVGGNKIKRYHLRFDQVTKKMMPDVNVLGAGVLNRILGDIDSAGIVAIDHHCAMSDIIIAKKFLHPHQLRTATSSSYVFSLGSG